MTYGDISPKVAAYSVVKTLERASPAITVSDYNAAWFGPKPEPCIQPIDTSCTICSADAGQPCKPIRRHVNWHGGWHAERREDARLLSQALDALKPQDTTIKVGDVVTFRRP